MKNFWCLIKFSDENDVDANLKVAFYCREKELHTQVMVYVERLRESNPFFKNLYYNGFEVINCE